jgi:isoleucyl-tRNA synthetase
VIANGHLYAGAKPVYWCLDCRSALAEAEVEYEDHTSPAIDVAFRIADMADFARRIAVQLDEAAPSSVVIWTTTPWTLPANEAVTLRADFAYVLMELEHEGRRQRIVLAEGLAPACLARYGVAASDTRVLARFEGRVLEGLLLQHPFHDRQVPVILGDHVTLEAGTGAVHTAPAHGLDDYNVGRRYNLPVVSPVQTDGRFKPDAPLVGGMKLEEGGKAIIAALAANGALLHHVSLSHSYPHCWRHKTPVIFLATPQWFISMDNQGLRANTLRDIATVQWTPAWGEQRIHDMIVNRPDWCVSRQRTWGVPIALFVHVETGELHPRTQELLLQVAGRVETGGIDAWFDLDPQELLGAEAGQYRKITDVMDVWADSGLSFETVPPTHPELGAPPFELYLEGSDQHRGWFHSSLLMSEALYQRAPYKGVLTHGFTVDEKGRKMSKSEGNTIAPDKVMNNLGADVLRLWVAATDYSGELAISDEILKRISDSYRRMRNTVRFLLGNLSGFDPARDALPLDELVDFDAWAIRRAAQLQQEVVAAYRDYQFHVVYQRVHNFCVNDLGGLYLDVLKDRMYTTPATGRIRRSAQTAMHHILQGMVRWLAPILSFTAEEIWQVMPGREAAPKSVFLTTWHEFPALPASTIDWDALITLRQVVQRELEKLREAGTIGAPLEAEVDVYALPELAARLGAVGDELRFLTITSAARVHAVHSERDDAVAAEIGNTVIPGLWVAVKRTNGNKCVRCWHLTDDVGSDAAHPELCGRCAGNVSGRPETRHHV